ncbi:MAG: hypothetical protein JXR96_16120 [Deltaproteobacteria bacterium]|nr:hypothetical protein [Deltaproteobacteria bacterium]
MVNAPEDVRNLGCYDYVKRGERAFHIQTEITGGERMEIRTTVMEGGRILDAKIRPYQDREDDIKKTKDIIAAQHSLAVTDVRRGKYD